MGLSVGGSDGWMFDGANSKAEGGKTGQVYIPQAASAGSICDMMKGR